MRISTVLFILLGFLQHSALTQDAAAQDTTLYSVVEEMPRFPGCEQLDTTLAAKNKCAQEQLLSFVYQSISYPEEARINGTEGTVVIGFIVEKDGSISNPRIVRNLEGGLGEEALRVVLLMRENNIQWIPGRQGGKPVRVSFNLPVKFRLEEALPYVVYGRDTIFTQPETPLGFEGGSEGLRVHLDEKLDYPPSGNDSCRIGVIDVQIIVRKSGDVRILDMTDYNDLGFDFWYEAIDAATSTLGKWKPATYEGRNVSSAYEMSLSFLPTADQCQQTLANYEKAFQLAEEGQTLIGEEQLEAGFEKLNQAVALFPDDAQLLFVRGQAYLDNNRLGEACADLRKAQRISLLRAYDDILPLICR